MKDLQLVIRPDAPSTEHSVSPAQAARELADWLRSEFRVAPRISAEHPPGTAPAVATRDSAVLELVVQISTVVLAVDKVAEKTKAKERLRQLSAWLRARRRRVTLRTDLLELELPGDDEHLDTAIDRLARRDET